MPKGFSVQRAAGRRPLSRGFSTRAFRALGLLLCLLTAPTLADSHESYKAALPLYQYDKTKPLTVKTVEAKAFSDCRMTRFSYASANGQRVPALLWVPRTATTKHRVPCLVLLHGLGTNKEIMAGLARYAATLGYASLAIDEYGQGERASKTANKTLSAAELQQQLLTGVPQTVVDVRRGLDYLGTRPNIDSKRLGLIGVSLGAIMGTVVSGVDKRVKATVLVSGGGDWALILKYLAGHKPKVGGRQITGTENIDWTFISAFLTPEDPLTFAPFIAPRALLMVNGKNDTTIIPQAAEELYHAATSTPGARVQRHWLNSGHIPAPELVYPLVRQWLAKNL